MLHSMDAVGQTDLHHDVAQEEQQGRRTKRRHQSRHGDDTGRR